MSEEIGDDELTVSIDKMLHNLSPKPENPSIYRVNDLLRNEKRAFIRSENHLHRPYHRCKQHLNKMEREKRYLKLLLASSNESSVDRYVKKIKGFEDRARKCYSEPIALGQDAIVQMLLLTVFSSSNSCVNTRNSTTPFSNSNTLHDTCSTICFCSRIKSQYKFGFELKEAGIRFDNCKDDGNISWLDIRFNKYKKICVPTLDISDVTESWFRNMIAYEYYLPSDHPKYVTDYTFFLHCLVHAPRDAQLLRRYGIISNWLGGDEMVYHLINQLGTNVLTSEKFSYSDVFCYVNRHCKRRRYRWIAILRRDYFDSPWKLISLVAGIVILGVGIVQMVVPTDVRTSGTTPDKTPLAADSEFDSHVSEHDDELNHALDDHTTD
ncbi:hypothetical protein DH2020_019741 [Rehmannia glutinosa]|uniref:Uncharacterized protein n=1 Tax=Rehmannia glutinosa TaxID=99300 RepID=A0ABR0WHZ7_REHGL